MLCYAKSLQLCPTLCNPIDCSSPGSPVPGILQARTLEWVAISFSNVRKWKVKVKSLSRVRLFVTLWTAVYQTSPSMGFSRQEYWSGVPLPSPLISYTPIQNKKFQGWEKKFMDINNQWWQKSEEWVHLGGSWLAGTQEAWECPLDLCQVLCRCNVFLYICDVHWAKHSRSHSLLCGQ